MCCWKTVGQYTLDKACMDVCRRGEARKAGRGM